MLYVIYFLYWELSFVFGYYKLLQFLKFSAINNLLSLSLYPSLYLSLSPMYILRPWVSMVILLMTRRGGGGPTKSLNNDSIPENGKVSFFFHFSSERERGGEHTHTMAWFLKVKTILSFSVNSYPKLDTIQLIRVHVGYFTAHIPLRSSRLTPDERLSLYWRLNWRTILLLYHAQIGSQIIILLSNNPLHNLSRIFPWLV